MAKPASFLSHKVITRSSLAIATALVLVLSSMQFSAVAAVDSAPKVILDVEGTSQSTYVTDRIRDMTVVGDKLFFVRDHASDGVGTAELWVSDGTAAGTTLLKQIQRDDELDDTTGAAGDLFYFFQAFETETQDVIRYELWKSDGTSSGTELTKGFDASGYYPDDLAGTSNSLFFELRDPDDNDYREVWTSDGTTEGTVQVNMVVLSALDGRHVVGETLFFWGDDTDGMLWKTTDGTSDTTVRVTTTDPGANNDGVGDVIVLGDWIYFSFGDGDTDLWRIESDAIESPGEPVTTEDVGPYNMTVAGDLLYFTDYCCELWVTNGTLTTEIESFDSQGVFDLTAVGDKLFFTVFFDQEDQEGGELWMTGGTLATTELIYSSREYDWDSDAPQVSSSTAVEETIFFYSSFAQTLRTSDGTVAGTLQVEADIDNDSVNDIEIVQSSNITSAGGVLYFTTNKAGARKLWSFNLNTAAPTGGGSYSAPVLPLATVQTKVVRLTGFNSDSSVLTKKARAGVTKAIKKFTAVNQVVCTGFTSGVMATTSQRKLALDRARKACRFVEKLAPDVVVKLKAAPAKGTGPKFRAVRVKITGN
jgi:ELWxxDGT repeat protein